MIFKFPRPFLFLAGRRVGSSHQEVENAEGTANQVKNENGRALNRVCRSEPGCQLCC